MKQPKKRNKFLISIGGGRAIEVEGDFIHVDGLGNLLVCLTGSGYYQLQAVACFKDWNRATMIGGTQVDGLPYPHQAAGVEPEPEE